MRGWYDNGPLILAAILIAVAIAIAGCRSYSSGRWPVDRLVDPVTEEVPHAILD